MIAVAVIVAFVVPPMWAFVISIAGALIALGTENKFLLKMYAVLGMIASIYLGFFAPSGWAAELLSSFGWTDTVFGSLVAWYMGPSAVWYRAAGFAFTAMSTAAMFKSLDEDIPYGQAFAELASSVASDIVGIVVGVVGGVIGGVVDGVLGGTSASNFLWTAVACYVGYKVLTADGPAVRVEQPAASQELATSKG